MGHVQGRRTRNAHQGEPLGIGMDGVTASGLRPRSQVHRVHARANSFRPEHRGNGRYSEEPQNRDTSKFIVSDTGRGKCHVRSSRDEAEELARDLGGQAQGVYVCAMPDSEVTTGQQIVAADLQQRARTSGGSRGCSSDPKPYLSSTCAPLARHPGRGNEFPERTEYGQESGPLDESGDDSGLAHHMSTVTLPPLASILSPRTRSRVPPSPGISARRSRGSNSGASGSRPSVGGGTSASSIACDSSGRSGLSHHSGGGSQSSRIRWPSPHPCFSPPNSTNWDKREGWSGEIFGFGAEC